VYLVDDVLVDAGTLFAKRRILRQVRSRGVRTHVLTHAHPDHFGSSDAVCEELGVPLWCGSEDADVVEEGLQGRLARAHPVARRLREGDSVASFSVLEVPGHSPGHVAYWRSDDRVLICGDVFFHIAGRLSEPWRFLSEDPAQNRESMRRLAELEPALVLFGHGPPLRDTERFVRFGRGV
jgi:hydroxyacylglutathione hydrolase